MVDEPLARVVLLESGDVWHRAHPTILNGKTEHPLQRRQFSIDARVRRAFLLAPSGVSLDAVRRNIDGMLKTKELAQVAD